MGGGAVRERIAYALGMRFGEKEWPRGNTGANPVRSEEIPKGWAFVMRDEKGTPVPVIVTDLALAALSSKCDLQIFLAYRLEVERIASAKHSAGRLEKDGTIKVASVDIWEASRSEWRRPNWKKRNLGESLTEISGF
jgi:hypothetical protein